MAGSQKIKEIPLKDLVMWTENPRDPINPNATDQEVAERAIGKASRRKWRLGVLFKKMGGQYDFSEIPTVVEEDGKNIVYDGNRRVLIGKIIHGYVEGFNKEVYQKFDFPTKIPCNVCDEKTALDNVYRKHGTGRGSWSTLERDIFLHKYMGHEKSLFMKIEKETELISSNQKMNQRYVKEEILTQENLNRLGIYETRSGIETVHKNEILSKIFISIVKKVETGQATTRKNRGEIVTLLSGEQDLQEHIKNDLTDSKSARYKVKRDSLIQLLTPPVAEKEHKLFGDKELELRAGQVNNLYLSILRMDKLRHGKDYNKSFDAIIRMALRLLCERAGCDNSNNNVGRKYMKEYVDNYFDGAKCKLTKDEKNTLSAQSVNKNSMEKLLNTGAHDYTASINYEQTIAMSLVIAKMLLLSHRKE